MMMSVARLAAIAIGLLAGCATFADLDKAEADTARSAPYPPIAPIDALLAAEEGFALDEGDAERAAVRAAALRGRAANLRRISP